MNSTTIAVATAGAIGAIIFGAPVTLLSFVVLGSVGGKFLRSRVQNIRNRAGLKTISDDFKL